MAEPASAIGAMPGFRVEAMAPGDIQAVVSLQTAHLDGSIVTQLGTAFLNKFHTIALAQPSVHAFIARDAGARLLGFAVGTTDVHAFNRHSKVRLLLPLARALMTPRNLHLLGSFIRMLGEDEPQPAIPGELLLLVVDSSARRRGVGRELLLALEDVFRQHQLERYRVAVRSHLADARAFYLALNFTLEQERLVLGKPMAYLTRKIGPPAHAS